MFKLINTILLVLLTSLALKSQTITLNTPEPLSEYFGISLNSTKGKQLIKALKAAGIKHKKNKYSSDYGNDNFRIKFEVDGIHITKFVWRGMYSVQVNNSINIPGDKAAKANLTELFPKSMVNKNVFIESEEKYAEYAAIVKPGIIIYTFSGSQNLILTQVRNENEPETTVEKYIKEVRDFDSYMAFISEKKRKEVLVRVVHDDNGFQYRKELRGAQYLEKTDDDGIKAIYKGGIKNDMAEGKGTLRFIFPDKIYYVIIESSHWEEGVINGSFKYEAFLNTDNDKAVTTYTGSCLWGIPVGEISIDDKLNNRRGTFDAESKPNPSMYPNYTELENHGPLGNFSLVFDDPYKYDNYKEYYGYGYLFPYTLHVGGTFEWKDANGRRIKHYTKINNGRLEKYNSGMPSFSTR